MPHILKYKYRIVYGALLLLSAAMAVRMAASVDWTAYQGDYRTFLTAAGTLRTGHPDVFRTPVYPLLMVLTQPLTADPMAPYPLLAINISLMLCSVEALRRLCLCMGLRRWMALALIAPYALLPGMTAWTAIPISDSLGISLTVIWLWATLRDAPGHNRASSALWSSLLLLVLVFLRPAFICLLPVAFLRWGYVFFKDSKRVGAAGLIGVSVTVAALGLYRAEIHRLYNIDSFTHVTSLNNLYLVIEHGVISDEDAVTEVQKRMMPVIRENCDTVCKDPLEIKFWYGFYPLPPDEMEDIVARTMRRDPGGIAETLWLRLCDRFFTSEAVRKDLRGVYRLFSTTIGVLTLFYLFMAAVLMAAGRRLTSPIRSWTVWLSGTAIMAVAFLGAMFDYSRLIAPAIAPSLILLGLALSLFHFKKSADEKLG